MLGRAASTPACRPIEMNHDQLAAQLPLWQAALSHIDASWLPCLSTPIVLAALQDCHARYQAEVAAQKTLYPPVDQLFAALAMPVAQVSCVIVGQDPYHGPNQANGLAFSVALGERVPPSLRNMYKELAQSTSFTAPSHGDLSAWVAQGVLLLNTAFSVEAHQAASHKAWPWATVSDALLSFVNAHTQHTAFLLWGKHAAAKASLIDAQRHLILSSAHPSPLSASRGFLGNRHFVLANDYLSQHGRPAIQWQLPPATTPQTDLFG